MATATELLEALRRDAICALQRATQPHGTSASTPRRDIVAAVDSGHHVVLEVLAYGAGGRQLYEDLRITRLVSFDTAAMDASAMRRQVGLSGLTQWPDHTVAFILPPSQANAQHLARCLHPFLHSTIHCVVLWLPAATSECTLEMERQGLAGIVLQRNLSLGLLPVDRNVATLCHDKLFAELYVHGQHHSLTRVVQSVLAIEKQASVDNGARGVIRQVTCHGPFAHRVKSMLDMAHRLQPPAPSGPSKFDRLILMDRMEDPLSMLLTPMNYEGLLDALIGMNHGVVSFDKPAAADDDDHGDLTGDLIDSAKTERVKLLLNHMDELFDEIRDVNINALISHRLAEIAQTLVVEARAGRGGGDTPAPDNASPSVATLTLAQVRQQLKKVPHLVKTKKALANHLVLVDQIQQRSQNLALRTCVETEMAILSGAMKRGIRLPGSGSAAGKDVDRMLEEAILRDDPPLLDVYDVLKLLCLLSLVSGGLKDERLQWYRQQLCHTYGYQILPLLVQLDKLELLSTKNKFDYQRRRSELSLMRGVLVEEEDATTTSLAPSSSTSSLSSEGAAAGDIHFMFPYTGYAPMSVRLVQTSLGMRVKPSKDIGNLFSVSSSASVTSISSTSSAVSSDAGSLFGGATTNPNSSGQTKRHVLVYYLGGVTVAELAAYRWLNATQSEFEFFIATTAISNGSRLLRAIQ